MTTAGSSRPSRGRRWVRVAIRIAATVLVTWLIVDRLGVGLEDALALGAAAPDPRMGFLAASIAVLLGGFGVSAWLWGRMSSELGGRPPGIWARVRIVFTANLARYLPGKIWQIAGLALLARRTGMSATIATASGILGQAFSLAATGVLAIPALLGVSGGAGAWGGVVVAGLAVLVGLTSVPQVLRRMLRGLYRLGGLGDEALPTTGALFGPRWLGWYLLNWVIYAAAFVLFARGLGWNLSGPWLASAFAAAYLMGYVAFFAPAGIGVREGMLIVLLRPMMGDASVAVALLTRIWMTAVELVPAGGFALWEVYRPARHEAPGHSAEERR